MPYAEVHQSWRHTLLISEAGVRWSFCASNTSKFWRRNGEEWNIPWPWASKSWDVPEYTLGPESEDMFLNLPVKWKISTLLKMAQPIQEGSFGIKQSKDWKKKKGSEGVKEKQNKKKQPTTPPQNKQLLWCSYSKNITWNIFSFF